MTKDLEELDALAAAATPGPWEYAEAKKGWGYPSLDIRQGYDGEMEERDAQFIAAARTAVPALIARVRALEALVDAVETLEAFRGRVREYDDVVLPHSVVRDVIDAFDALTPR